MPVEIEAGKLGRQIDSRGVIKEFTPEFFQEVIESYDPNNFKAPAIISHDTKGIPDDKLHTNKELCYGVASGLKMVGDRLKISFDKLSPKIKEHFDNGELLSVSPSFYPPTHHANPTPGKWSLRHLGFLGASPPAIKGLAAPTFSETGYNPAEHTLDFSFPGELKETGEALEFSIFTMRSLFSNLRDWLIEKHGKEEAEKIIPGHSIENMVMDDRFQQDELDQLRRRINELEKTHESGGGMRAIPLPSLYQEDEAHERSGISAGNPRISSAQTTNSKLQTNKSKNMKTNPKVDPDLEMEDMEDEDEEDEQEETPPTKKKKKTIDMSEETIDYAAELAEERRARKLLEFQVQNEQRKAEKERSDRKFDKITNFCENLVREGQLAAQQIGDRLLEFGEGEETQQSLPEFLMSLDEQQLSFMEDYLSSQPKIIDYGEFAKDNDDSAAHRAIDFNAVPGASISDESRDEFEEILHYCEQHSLDPNDDDDFNQAAKAVLR